MIIIPCSLQHLSPQISTHRLSSPVPCTAFILTTEKQTEVLSHFTNKNICWENLYLLCPCLQAQNLESWSTVIIAIRSWFHRSAFSLSMGLTYDIINKLINKIARTPSLWKRDNSKLFNPSLCTQNFEEFFFCSQETL